MGEYIVELKNIKKSFEGFDVIQNMSLGVKPGEFLTLLGPSGCGKTTTLRMIAGFEKPTSGDITINNEIVSKVEPCDRDINTVFQHYSLFPHMTIFKNIAFGLKMKKVNKNEINERVNRVLDMVQLKHLSNRKPKQLSGGQQQRIAIARAIVNNPQVLLLDEPLGALDLKLRKQMQLELKRLQESLGITFIYVTHDQEEALTMSDRIVVMNEGNIEQLDTARNIYEKPQSLFVADFIGETNILEGIPVEHHGNDIKIKMGKRTFLLPAAENIEMNDKVYLSIRPEKVHFSYESTSHANQMKSVIKEVIYSGAVTKVNVELPDGQIVTVQSTNGATFNRGDDLYIYWDTEHVTIHHTVNKNPVSNEKELANA